MRLEPREKHMLVARIDQAHVRHVINVAAGAAFDAKASSVAPDLKNTRRRRIGADSEDAMLGFVPGDLVQQPTSRRDLGEHFTLGFRHRFKIDQTLLERVGR